MSKRNVLYLGVSLLLLLNCTPQKKDALKSSPKFTQLVHSKNSLNYIGTPSHKSDKSMLMFSDQGAWFAYSMPDSITNYGGFSGPYLLTQQNGVWTNPSLATLTLTNTTDVTKTVNWKKDITAQESYSSHLEQRYKNDSLSIQQELVFISGHTALQRTKITNTSSHSILFDVHIKASLFDIGIKATAAHNYLKLDSKHSTATGYLQFVSDQNNKITIKDSINYQINHKRVAIAANTTENIIISQTFIFPEYSWKNEKQLITNSNFDSILLKRKLEKEQQLIALNLDTKQKFKNVTYAKVLAKAQLTLQNNWRIPAGELKHAGLFPSYHYKWFNGFWSWDSWKHAVGLSYYNTDLAKSQVKTMFHFQNSDGFIVDCVYRDTTIEAHNYRDTKPPLATWAVAKIYQKDKDTSFIKELYPKLKLYHNWWYNKRDHDKDGLCEYGSTDGSLIAAKWESGMDNAIRFDNSKILKNSDGAYSIDQESVDLNAYLYAEKLYLAKLAKILEKNGDVIIYKAEAALLKEKIQSQFYDANDGWFYDTNLEGTTFIKGEGSEGWTALWANAATQEQALAVKNKMMNPAKFYTKVPFQTMSADHEKFNPLRGYWRGPNWLDQAYFGVKGLQNYGFIDEAYKATEQIISGAEGILEDGKSIRENYHPITGKGLNAQNFSWSAAHIIMLLTNDEDEL